MGAKSACAPPGTPNPQTLPPDVLTVVAAVSAYAKIEKLKRHLNELEALEKRYLRQLTRISAACAIEGQIKFPNAKLHKDIQLAKDLLVEAAKLKMDMGASTAARRLRWPSPAWRPRNARACSTR